MIEAFVPDLIGFCLFISILLLQASVIATVIVLAHYKTTINECRHTFNNNHRSQLRGLFDKSKQAIKALINKAS